MGSTTSIYGIKWPNRSTFRIWFFLKFGFLPKCCLTTNRKKVGFKPQESVDRCWMSPLKNFEFQVFRIFGAMECPFVPKHWIFFAKSQFLDFKVFRTHGDPWGPWGHRVLKNEFLAKYHADLTYFSMDFLKIVIFRSAIKPRCAYSLVLSDFRKMAKMSIWWPKRRPRLPLAWKTGRWIFLIGIVGPVGCQLVPKQWFF